MESVQFESISFPEISINIPFKILTQIKLFVHNFEKYNHVKQIKTIYK
jgi:hypothetical protein